MESTNNPPPTFQAYGELQEAYDHFNRALFDGALPFCLITFQREKRTYGYFSFKRFVHRHDKQITDEIAINPSYFAVVPLLEVLQTIVHEMAHLWQFHFGKPGRRGYHNKEWASKMESIGLMPSSTGQPGGAKTGEKIADYAIEGGRFMAAATELMTADFRISWLDRFPPMRAQPTVSELLDTLPLGTQSDGGEDGQDSQGQELGALIEPQGPRNRSNRVKYRCPGCGVQVWGKPEIRLLCGGQYCEAAELEAVEEKAAKAAPAPSPASASNETGEIAAHAP